MASLTPGVLSKLLENAGKKVTAPHRQALLQVTEIVPRLSDEQWQSRGYFLKLSDSLHSAYVSVSDDDSELICAGNLQLGQFVYVTRLDSASPVPLVRGLNPIPKRRPCVGNPTDLVSSELLLVTPKLKKKDCESKRGSNSPSPAKKKLDLEMRRLSLDSSRRVWDQKTVAKAKTVSSSSPASDKLKLKKSNTTSPNVIEKKLSVKAESPLKSPTSGVSPLKNKNENLCPRLLTSTPPTPRKSTSTRLPCVDTVHSQLVKVPLNLRNWCDAWEDLPSPVCSLGKQVLARRNAAFMDAVRSLEEASATETVIQCMSMFAELCQSSKTQSAGLLVKQFLELHVSLLRVKMVFDSLPAPLHETKPSSHSTLQCLAEDTCKVPSRNNAISWVQAAVGTNLSKFNLFGTQTKSEVRNGEKCHYVVIADSSEEVNTEDSFAPKKQNRVTQAKNMSNSTSKRLSSSKRNLLVAKNKYTDKQDQSKESELKVAANFADKLLEASQEWFLKYLEVSLGNEFGLKNEGNTEIACLLGQLKQVNHWLDNLAGRDKVDHRVESLRKSLYRLLLEHVNSTSACN